MNRPTPPREIPSAELIATLPLFERLGLPQVTLVNDTASAEQAHSVLINADVLGFDTESKPTFKVGEISTGPHVLQLATLDHAWLFLLHNDAARRAAAALLVAQNVIKAGFGLKDDKKHIERKLGIEPDNVLDLNHRFRALGYRKDMGVKGAVAVLFNQRFIKSKKAATSNWSYPRLTEAQMIYAANDAYAAMRVFVELKNHLEPL